MKQVTRRIDPRDIFVRGKQIVLKVLNEDDVANSNWYGWFNDVETTQLMQKHYYPNSENDQLEFLRTQLKGSKTKIQLGICRGDALPIVGVVSLNDIDLLHRKAEIAAVIGEKTARNVSVMLEAVDLMIHHAFVELNLHRIDGGTIIKELAVLLCRSFGFRQEGVFRQDVFHQGQYHDVYRVGLLDSEYRPLTAHPKGG